MELLAQLIMAATLILMVVGKTPLYTTAIVGSTIATLVYGIPLIGDADVTIKSLVIEGLNPVIADMAGVLLFIGVMEHAGYLNILVNAIIRSGNKLGGGPASPPRVASRPAPSARSRASPSPPLPPS